MFSEGMEVEHWLKIGQSWGFFSQNFQDSYLFNYAGADPSKAMLIGKTLLLTPRFNEFLSMPFLIIFFF